MTTTTAPNELWARASHVTDIVLSSLAEGGPLYRELSDLLSKVEGVAMRAAGVPDVDDIAAAVDINWPTDHDTLVDSIGFEISQEMFKATRAYLEATAVPA